MPAGVLTTADEIMTLFSAEGVKLPLTLKNTQFKIQNPLFPMFLN